MIFSGDDSEHLWDAIGDTQEVSPNVHDAIYLLGCRCQELEELVRKQAAQIAELEKRPLCNHPKGEVLEHPWRKKKPKEPPDAPPHRRC